MKRPIQNVVLPKIDDTCAYEHIFRNMAAMYKGTKGQTTCQTNASLSDAAFDRVVWGQVHTPKLSTTQLTNV